MKVELSHTLENTVNPLHMGFWVKGGDKKVIHADDQPSFSDHVSEGVIHELLECGGGVAKTKEHDSWFEESFVGDEGRLPLVTVFDVDIVVPPSDVKLDEVASIFQLVHKVGDERKGVGIMGDVFIQVSVVLTGAEFSILFFDKEEKGGLWGVGRMNLSSGQVFFEEVLGGFLFIGRKWIDFVDL